MDTEQRVQRGPPTHLGGDGLHGSEVVLQGQAAVIVEYGLHSDEMRLHQPLPLSGDLLLQRLKHRLEVLVSEREQTEARVRLVVNCHRIS